MTHDDDRNETIWFERVADVAAGYDLPWIAPADPNTPEHVARIAALAPDFVFSFYYRRMLKRSLLALPRRGALNMHGSLCPSTAAAPGELGGPPQRALHRRNAALHGGKAGRR